MLICHHFKIKICFLGPYTRIYINSSIPKIKFENCPLMPYYLFFQYKKRLVEAQVKLEKELRREEDEMFKVFQMERENEKRKLTDEIKKEWEVKLKELTDMYERNLSKKKKKTPEEERKVCLDPSFSSYVGSRSYSPSK